MGASGDFKELRLLQRRIRGLGGGGFQTTLSRALAETARERIKESFRLSQDPYGRTWKASTQRRGPEKGSFKTVGQILRDRGILFKSLVPSQINEQGFRISTAVKYARIHQKGGRITIPFQRRTLAHRRGGKFMSRAAAGKARRAVRVSFADYGARSFQMPRRQYMPDGGRLGPIWRKAFFGTVRRVTLRHMGRGSLGAG